MKKFLKVVSALILLIIAILFIYDRWLSETVISKDNNLIICGKPDSIVYRKGKLDSITKYTGNPRIYERDLRYYDPSGLDLRNNLTELLHSDFDSKTNWPKALPEGFNPDSIMEIGKNPGLGIRKIHENGITGKGVGIAIIDQSLLVDHTEYKDQLRMYEQIHGTRNQTASMHGTAVASIAVGRTVGVAPDADLYYIYSFPGTIFSRINQILFNNSSVDSRWFAESIYRILEINKTLPPDKKIRVISISFGSYEKSFLKAIAKAEKEGVFVISSALQVTHHLQFRGLGRESLSDPDDFKSFMPGSSWANTFYSDPGILDSNLLVPMDSRCTASQSGKRSYAFYSAAGVSWSIPYVAGLYALACQVKPDVTPQEFWKKALETGEEITIVRNNRDYKFGRIVNPSKLIGSLKGSSI